MVGNRPHRASRWIFSKMMKTVTAGCLALLLSGAARAQAPSDDADALSLSGFATLGLAHSNTDAAQFIRYNQARGATRGYTSNTDSNLGLQASYRFTPTISATVQLLVRQATASNYSVDPAWAFVRVRLDEALHLRLGRTAVPSFMLSEAQNIGYANTMIRPPIEMYGLAAIENVDGADLSYEHGFGETNFTAQLAGGVGHGKLLASGGAGAVLHYRAPIVALNLVLERGPLTLRASRLRTSLASDDFSVLNHVTAQLGDAGYAALARDLALGSGKKIDFTALGLALDWQPVLLQGEYGRRQAVDPVYVPDNDAWYLMAGYRVGAWLPYYAHATLRQRGRSVTLPADLPRDGALFHTIDYGLLTAGQQHSDLLGLRWNFAAARALKLQLDRVRATAKNGVLIDGPADGLKRPVLVLALALDMVF